jgi:sugar lactone lactonase YvrE
VAVDDDGNVFIADSSNSRIRRVATATGVITTVAGNGVSGFCGDGGPAASSCLNRPSAVAVGARGSLFVADSYNHRIRLVTLGGVVTTLAGSNLGFANGTGAAGTFYSPSGVAVDPFTDRVYVADTFNQRIRQVTLPYS